MKIKILLVLAILLFINGCQEERAEFRQEELVMVNDYVLDITLAMETIMPDLKGWERSYYEESYPYSYDSERVEWLARELVELESIEMRRYLDDFPSLNEIRGWEVVVVREDQEWLLSGEELAAALTELYGTGSELISVVTIIIENEGVLNEDESDRVNVLIETVNPAIERVREILCM